MTRCPAHSFSHGRAAAQLLVGAAQPAGGAGAAPASRPLPVPAGSRCTASGVTDGARTPAQRQLPRVWAPQDGSARPGLTLHRLRIPDFCPPGPEQIDRFVKIVQEANARGEVSGRSQRGEGGTLRGVSGDTRSCGRQGQD